MLRRVSNVRIRNPIGDDMAGNSIDAGVPSRPPVTPYEPLDAGPVDVHVDSMSVHEEMVPPADSSVGAEALSFATGFVAGAWDNLPGRPTAEAILHLMSTASSGGDVGDVFIQEVEADHVAVASEAYGLTQAAINVYENGLPDVDWSRVGAMVQAAAGVGAASSLQIDFSKLGIPFDKPADAPPANAVSR
jgi:hypothetical protein